MIEKEKALEMALSQIEKQFGKGAVMKLGEESHLNIETIPTGALGLDIALGVGGVPRGRIVEIFGPESSGKTTVALHIIAEAQKAGGEAAYEIINKKGATYYAVALAVRRIVEAIIRNENSVMTVSSLLEGQYGLSEVCLSVPSIVNSNGVESILEVPIDNTEKELLIKSGQTIKEVIKSLNI
jgi:RecA/RadA recombinase